MSISRKHIIVILATLIFLNFNTVKCNDLDSLKLQLLKTDPEKKACIFIKIAELYKFENLDSALKYLEKSNNLCEEFGDQEQLARTFGLLR